MEELIAIRELWVIDKNEIEDILPDIFFKSTGKEFPYPSPYEGAITKEDISVLRESNNDSYDDIHYQLIRNLISIEQKYSTTSRRVGVYDELTGTTPSTDGYTKTVQYAVRYDELLSFVSAYNEQRFTSIESRLTVRILATYRVLESSVHPVILFWMLKNMLF